MNTKASSKKTKSASPVKRKAVPAVTSRAKPTAAQSSSQARKTVTARSAKAPSAKVELPDPAEHTRDSKQARLIAMLRIVSGATVDQMMTLTGWQAHTVRGVISGVLRKKLGLNVTCERAADSGESTYRIVGSEACA